MATGMFVWALQVQATGQVIPHAFQALDTALIWLQQNEFDGEFPTLAGTNVSYVTTNAGKPVFNVVQVDIL